MNTNHGCMIAGIPCIRILPNTRSKGVILLYHGWISNMHDYVFFGSLLSDWGYEVIIPEIPYHGVRGKLNYYDSKVLQRHYWNVVLQAVEESRLIIDELIAADKLVGVIGNSAGGFIAAGVFSKHINIKTAVVLNGSCAWVRFEEQICRREKRDLWTSTSKSLVERLDPINSIENLKHRALLILHGKEDTTIPIDSQRYFMQVVEQNNLSKSVKTIEYSDVNHQLTLGMLEEVKQWLIKLEDGN